LNLDLRTAQTGAPKSGPEFRSIPVKGEKFIKSRIEIRKSIIEGCVDATKIIFKFQIDFDDTVFIKNVTFYESEFEGYAFFRTTKFKDSADFRESDFKGDAEFEYTHFLKRVRFNGSTFRKMANFQFAEFAIKADDEIISEYLSSFTPRKPIEFVDTTFSGACIFYGAKFYKNVDSSHSKFDKLASFNKTQFNGTVSFEDAHFSGDTKFFETKFDGELDLNRAIFNKLFIKWSDIKDCLKYNDLLYLELVKNYKNLSWFEYADDCYYELMKRKRKDSPLLSMSKIYYIFSQIFCGFGVRLRFPLGCIFGSIFGFSILYNLLNGITKSSPPEITMSALNNSILLFTFAPNEISPSFWECLYFSAVSFVGGTPVGLIPVGVWKYAVMFESVLGYLFLALFIVVLARKLIR